MRSNVCLPWSNALTSKTEFIVACSGFLIYFYGKVGHFASLVNRSYIFRELISHASYSNREKSLATTHCLRHYNGTVLTFVLMGQDACLFRLALRCALAGRKVYQCIGSSIKHHHRLLKFRPFALRKAFAFFQLYTYITQAMLHRQTNYTLCSIYFCYLSPQEIALLITAQ